MPQTLDLHPMDAGYAIASLNKIDQICLKNSAFDKWMCPAEPSQKTSAMTRQVFIAPTKNEIGFPEKEAYLIFCCILQQLLMIFDIVNIS